MISLQDRLEIPDKYLISTNHTLSPVNAGGGRTIVRVWVWVAEWKWQTPTERGSFGMMTNDFKGKQSRTCKKGEMNSRFEMNIFQLGIFVNLLLRFSNCYCPLNRLLQRVMLISVIKFPFNGPSCDPCGIHNTGRSPMLLNIKIRVIYPSIYLYLFINLQRTRAFHNNKSQSSSLDIIFFYISRIRSFSVT